LSRGGDVAKGGERPGWTAPSGHRWPSFPNAYGSAIFFVSNDHSGNIVIASSIITNNFGGSWYPTYPQISNHDDTPITVTDSTIR
jgi:hypothetical protein